ncbi:MAG: RNA 2',3'-cyclic phosphodiesterase [Alphaproteobacteria bacterium]|nr:RNA 2',3'-cyclic phosphodiesterase [Alphaproteobacteria bacterium]
MIRLFVGLSLPLEVRQRLAAMSGGVPGARWEPEENFHLTLRFIGDVEHGQADDIHGELSRLRMPAFEIGLSAIDYFGAGDKARVLYVGVDRNELLMRLQAKIDNAVQRAGLPREARKFRPHVTLARLRDAPVQRLAAFREAYNLFRAGPIPVKEFGLYSSHPGKGNAVYHEEASYPLDGG